MSQQRRINPAQPVSAGSPLITGLIIFMVAALAAIGCVFFITPFIKSLN